MIQKIIVAVFILSGLLFSHFLPSLIAVDESGYGYRQYEKRVNGIKKNWQKDHIDSGTYKQDEKGFIKGIKAYNKKRMKRPSYKAPRAGDKTGRTVVRPVQKPNGTTNKNQTSQ